MAQLTHEELANLAAAGVETPTENPPSATKVKTEETDSTQANNEDTSGDKSQGSTEQDEPQEQAAGDSEAEAEESIQTQKRRTYLPALKLGVAGVGMLPIFLILWGILTDGTSPQVAQKASESNQKQLGSKVGEEKGRLKTELAVKNQEQALKKLEQSKQQKQKKPKQAEKQQPQQASQPAQPASPEPAQPVAASPSPSPQPAKPASQPSPSPAPQPSPQPQQPQVASRPEPAPQPSAPQGSEPEQDPMAQWKQAAQLGSYGESSSQELQAAASSSGASSSGGPQLASASAGNGASAQPASANSGGSSGWSIQGATGSSSGGSSASSGSQLASASTGGSGIGNYQPPGQSQRQTQQRQQPQARPAVRQQRRQPQAQPAGAFEGRQAAGDSMGGDRVMPGATTTGELQVPVAWSKGGTPRKTVVRLAQPLEASNGEEALPAGALVVAEPQSSGSGLVQLSATKAIVERSGRQIQKNLPSGAIRVVSEGGEPLRADRRDPNTVGNDIASVLLGGVGKAAEALNQGNRSIRLSQGAAITENGDPNMWAGAAEGAAKSASELLKQRNQQSRQQQQQQAPVYAIDRGTDVQLIANQVVDI